MTTIEKINGLDDFKVLRFYEHISNQLVKVANTDAASIIGNMPAQMANTSEIQQIKNADEAAFDKTLDNKEAVVFARQSLKVLAENTAGQLFLEDQLTTYKDNSMIAGTILAIGGAISMVMLLANSEFSYDRKNGLKIGIGTIKDKDQVAARTGMMQSLLNIIPGLKQLLGH